MNFTALDVETANPDRASICQIGLANYDGGNLSAEWKSLVDPEDYFDPFNISIHRINEQAVMGEPRLPAIARPICEFIGDRVVVCHTPFDRVSMRQAFAKYGLANPSWTWLDSACVARRTWEQFAWRGYGLPNVCKTLGYEYAAHDALEDAKAAGQVILAAIKTSGIDLEGWLKLVDEPLRNFCTHERPSPPKANKAIKANPTGPLSGEFVVFTGTLSLPRQKAEDMASGIGCTVEDGVTRKTTMLIVGDQDIRRLAGHEKSGKHRRAEELIKSGQAIRILQQSDFEQLVQLANNQGK